MIVKFTGWHDYQQVIRRLASPIFSNDIVVEIVGVGRYKGRVLIDEALEYIEQHKMQDTIDVHMSAHADGTLHAQFTFHPYFQSKEQEGEEK